MLYDARSANQGLCDNLDNLEGWYGVRGGKEIQARWGEEGTRIYPWLMHIDVWQKPTQHCKAIILQLKINYM